MHFPRFSLAEFPDADPRKGQPSKQSTRIVSRSASPPSSSPTSLAPAADEIGGDCIAKWMETIPG